MRSRGLSPVIGVVCLVGLTVGLAAVVGLAVPTDVASEPTVAAFDASVEPTGELRMTHRGGDPIDPGAIDLEIRIDGDPLERQPPVPFFSAGGFESAPKGAFNSARTEPWRTGETASLRIAETNEPTIEAGDTVVIRLTVDGYSVAELETTA
ncbi:type IV pilin N-terminal domain-containing protein [Natronomonas sp. F2-12]|jgi:FlaG/FlaF family flagellin (archaellin)|uniref:Type IV pilin N-terminal domain-containing protein n=1 Tax=Natronomonas aquatica TaxID=2841590 RepID=A0A9R1CUX8_9EURY|nr:type IV pilin N-terminal domain-containing protein [Natronomonas aquatica]MCQ4334006.1 type IV pilin N-terminal domain-containing protein [Natronomonas aquatica]